MKKYIYSSVAKNDSSRVGGRTMSEKDIVSVKCERALTLNVGEEITLDEDEVGYTDYQNFITTIRRIE